MAEKLDYKKAFKDLYMPKTSPGIIEVPAMRFIMVEGQGNPNSEGGEYQAALELLYGISFTIKMSKMGAKTIDNYFEYVVPPLEGLWWFKDGSHFNVSGKENFAWFSMIRQPEFVTEEVFTWASQTLKKKRPQCDVTKAALRDFTEGKCVQIMHKGPYDDEPATIAKLDAFIKENNLENGIGTASAEGITRHHHEIYLSDPRKSAPEKLSTVIRIPVI